MFCMAINTDIIQFLYSVCSTEQNLQFEGSLFYFYSADSVAIFDLFKLREKVINKQ